MNYFQRSLKDYSSGTDFLGKGQSMKNTKFCSQKHQKVTIFQNQGRGANDVPVTVVMIILIEIQISIRYPESISVRDNSSSCQVECNSRLYILTLCCCERLNVLVVKYTRTDKINVAQKIKF